jgi:hypothetical protein
MQPPPESRPVEQALGTCCFPSCPISSTRIFQSEATPCLTPHSPCCHLVWQSIACCLRVTISFSRCTLPVRRRLAPCATNNQASNVWAGELRLAPATGSCRGIIDPALGDPGRKYAAPLSSTHTYFVCIGNAEEPEIRGRIQPKYAASPPKASKPCGPLSASATSISSPPSRAHRNFPEHVNSWRGIAHRG